jgi:hypothetical protein
VRELFRLETEAVKHYVREARRLGSASPARVLLRLAHQSERLVGQLPDVARAHALACCFHSASIGAFFSAAGSKLVERWTRSERSYRTTMLGVHQSMDVMQLLASTAREAGLTELERFCATWLEARRPLVHALESELVWFAKHPAGSMRLAR